MAPKRKFADLPQKSIWDESLLSVVLTNNQHRAKLLKHLLLATRNSSPSATDAKAEKESIEEVRTVSAGCGAEQCCSAEKEASPHPKQVHNPYKLRDVTSLAEIPYAAWNIPKKQFQRVVEEFSLFTTRIVERSESARGDTTKLLIELQDGHQVETVIMRHVGHATACVSSQIGCQMGCRFCATGTMGIIGDLTTGEILEQLVHANSVTRIRNVVFMGMGEPLNNFDNVKRAIESMVDMKRFGMAPRHITVSTVGVLKSMYRLSDELPLVNLALSLHAPNQDVRVQIVPAARAHPIEKLMAAVDYHNEKGQALDPKRAGNVMIEYILIRDVNDKDEHAHELAKLLVSRRDYVFLNLIPYNPTEVAEDYLPPLQEQIESFHRICLHEPYKIHCRVRHEKGQDIAGACGQLALVKANPAQKKDEQERTTDLEDLLLLQMQENKSTVFAHTNNSPNERKQAFPWIMYANLLVPIAVLATLHAFRRK